MSWEGFINADHLPKQTIKLTQPGVIASYKLLNICMGQLGKKDGWKKQSKFMKRP